MAVWFILNGIWESNMDIPDKILTGRPATRSKAEEAQQFT